MRAMTMLVLAVTVAASGCSNSPAAGESTATAAARNESCELLTAGDVQSVTGIGVTRVGYNPTEGLGGNCANFADGKGQPYLGVNWLTSRELFTATIAATPEEIYPKRETLSGLGDEALMLSGGDDTFRLRVLLARKGDQSVVLFPMLDGMAMPDEQLRALAERAVSRLE